MSVHKILAKVYLGSNLDPTTQEISDITYYCAREIENTLAPREIHLQSNSITKFSVSEATYNKDESLITIEVGCDATISLEQSCHNFRDVFESLAADLVDPEKNEYGLKADLIDFTNLQYQSYSEGDFDEGNFSDSDDYVDLIEDFRTEIEDNKGSIINKWLTS
jgi:U3 small nucleolar ribonucleoprotein component